METLLIVIVVLLVVAIGLLLALLLRRRGSGNGQALNAAVTDLSRKIDVSGSDTRGEIMAQFKHLNQISLNTMSSISNNTRHELQEMRNTVDKKLYELQLSNEKRLGELREMVGASLSKTVSEGLDSSFQSVSAQLDRVSGSIGEMRALTADIADLRSILANVKNRGTWGEVQLGAIIADILAPSQYEEQFSLGTREMVDFAVKLPGNGDPIYLPIDSKFPMDKYQAVVLAESSGDQDAIALTKKALVAEIIKQAKSISTKYIVPGRTTDYAILFVPSEGLYALLASLNLAFRLQREYRILLAGPSSLASLLNSLQLGFRSMAIEQRSGEILQLFGAVKKSFGAFTESLESVRKSIRAADNNLAKAEDRSRSIERSLAKVDDSDL